MGNTIEKKIERINLVLHTIRNVHRLLVKENDRWRLIEAICRTLVKNRGYYNAWIALFNRSGDFEEAAQAGVGDKFASIVTLFNNGDIMACVKNALSQPQLVLTEDPQSECTDCILSGDYGGRGAMTVRLDHSGRVFGILCVSTPRDLVADEEERRLIADVAKDIAFALGSIELANERDRTERLLQESENRYRSVFENTGTAVVIIEEDMTLSMVNTQFERLSGFSKKEVDGRKKWTEFVAGEDLARLKEYHFKRRRDEKSAPSEYEFLFIDKSGSTKEMFCRIGMIPGTHRSIASFIDLTSLKRAENALQESEQKLRTLMGNLPGMVYRRLNDKDWTMEYVSDGCLELTGYRSHDLIENGRTSYSDLILPEHRDNVWHSIQTALKKRSPFKLIYRIRSASGADKWVWEQGTGVFSKVGDLLRLEGFVTDITERVLAEEALQESEQRFRDLIENSLIGISIIQNGCVAYRNPEQQRLFGPPTKSTNPFNMDNIHPDDKEKVQKSYHDMVAGKSGSFQTDFRLYPSAESGSKPTMKWVYCRANRITYEGKDAILTNILDMTRAKELEHFLLIQDKMASLGHMAAGIAHEIRSPLSGINIYLNTLGKACSKLEETGKMLEIIEQIKSASQKIESVIRGVMGFSRPGAPKFVLGHVNEPIDEAVKLASVTLRKSGIQIKSHPAKDLPLCLIDPQMLEEVLLNLITNAADAMKDLDNNKRIEIVSSLEKDSIQICVSDSGPGVPFYHREKIFDPFYTTKRDSSGIGLSITHRIVRDHGGSIAVGTSKWGGAEFKVRIPLA
jgi:PAS domain S-box-containing protein